MLALATPFAASAQTTTITCGTMGNPFCTANDPEYNVQYNGDTRQGYTGQACDLGLDAQQAGGSCSPGNRLLAPRLSAWDQFAAWDESFGTQVDQAINWITTFGTHNSYSDNQDSSYSSFSFFNTDQYYSITDQLNSGARMIRLDPITFSVRTDSDLRVCHQSSDPDFECNNTSTGRLFAYALAEVKQWLDTQEGEILIIRMYRTQSSDWANIDAAISGSLGDSYVLMPSAWNPDSQGWPTLRQMRALGNRVVFLADTASINHAFNWTTSVIPDGYTDNPDPYPNNYDFTACYNAPPSGPSQQVFTRAYNQFAYIGEDRSYSDYGGGSPGSGFLDTALQHTPADVQVAAKCGYSMIAVDFLDAGNYAPHLSSLYNNWDTQFPMPDTRFEDATWSWEIGDMGTGPAGTPQAGALMGMDGRLTSHSVGEAHPFACATNGGSVSQPAATLWAFTTVQNTWEGGYSECAALGGGARYWAPQSAFEAQTLVQSAGFTQPVWVAYQNSTTPTLYVAPIDNFVNINEGQGLPATLTINFTGGMGGPISYNIVPAAQSLISSATVNYVAKTVTLNLNPQAYLGTGTYSQTVNIIESSPFTSVAPSTTAVTVTGDRESANPDSVKPLWNDCLCG